MTVYVGTFQKKDGSSRTMKFVRLKDLPSIFLRTHIKGTSHPVVKEGQEIVWDVEKQNFRIFNWQTENGNLKILEEDLKF